MIDKIIDTLVKADWQGQITGIIVIAVIVFGTVLIVFKAFDFLLEVIKFFFKGMWVKN